MDEEPWVAVCGTWLAKRRPTPKLSHPSSTGGSQNSAPHAFSGGGAFAL